MRLNLALDGVSALVVHETCRRNAFLEGRQDCLGMTKSMN